ncbi:hypothetical protein XENTR_v10010888 [Xenopus tropicalis]|nr:hypothetical protein XENTR_v10010888 [Xenopus tropicalis]
MPFGEEVLLSQLLSKMLDKLICKARKDFLTCEISDPLRHPSPVSVSSGFLGLTNHIHGAHLSVIFLDACIRSHSGLSLCVALGRR